VAYVGASDSQKLNAIDARDGRLIWEFDTEGSAWAQPAVSANTVYIGAVGVKDYFVKHAAGFFAVNRETGQPIWTYAPIGESDAAEFGFASSPSVGAGRVYVGGLDGRIYAFEAEPDSRELRSGSDP